MSSSAAIDRLSDDARGALWDLTAEWQRTHLGWHDPGLLRFEQNYVEPVGREVQVVCDALARLGAVLGAADQVA